MTACSVDDLFILTAAISCFSGVALTVTALFDSRSLEEVLLQTFRSVVQDNLFRPLESLSSLLSDGCSMCCALGPCVLGKMELSL